MTGEPPAPPRWQHLCDVVAARCASAGLDLAQPFRVDWYNGVVDDVHRLPDFGRGAALALLIGNTRALWPRFIASLRAEPARLDGADPLDDFTAGAVARALFDIDVRHEVRGASEPPPRRVAMQRLAHVAGLAHLSASHLSVHPLHGPWIALRAAVVFDADGPPGAAADPPSPCGGCAAHCLPAFERAVAAVEDPIRSHDDLGRSWPLWLAVRDACPVGRASRYDDDQIAYHYTKDRAILTRLVATPGRS